MRVQKVKRVNWLYSIFLWSGILLLTLFSGCEVGLGEAVDTTPPTLSIKYPPMSSTIRDSFILYGICEDDKGIASVNVKVTNTDQGRSYGEYSATIQGNTWSVTLNGNGSYNGWAMPDGRYVADVQATDGSGRTSGISSIAFDIDNTAPLFILSSPASKLKDSPTAYGSSLKVAGTIADDHTVSYMNLKVFDSEVNPATPGAVALNGDGWTETNIETAGGTEIVFANEKGNATQIARYKQIYTKQSGDQKYACVVKVSDSAKVYKNPQEIQNTTTGNETSIFYLYDDVYTNWLSAASGLDASTVKKIINGNVDSTSIAADKIENAKSDYINKKSECAYFSLNPDGNPKYQVFGFGVEDPTIITNKATPGQSVTVNLIAGRNGIKVDPDTIAVYLFGSFEEPLPQEKYSMLTSSVENFKTFYADVENNKGMLLAFNGDPASPNAAKIEYPITPREAVESFPYGKYQAGSVESYNLQVQLPGSLDANKYYYLAVFAQDKEGSYADPNTTIYAFTGYATSAPPSITWPDKNNASYTNDADDQDIIKNEYDGTGNIIAKKLHFEGFVENPDGIKEIASVKYKVTIKDEVSGAAVEGGIGGNGIDVPYYDVENGKWAFEIDALTDPNKMYSYDITIEAINRGGQSDKQNKKIHFDTTMPEISINSIVPEIKKTGDENKYLNGTFTISGKANDKNLEKVWYEVKADGTTVYNSTDTDAGQWYSFETKIDSTDSSKFGDLNNKKIEVVLHAIDSANNEKTYSTTEYLNIADKSYKIDQETDRPVITGSNFVWVTDEAKLTANPVAGATDSGNVFDTTSNNKLMFSVSDDDGIASLKVTCKKSGDGSVSSENIPISGTPTSGSYSYTLPVQKGAGVYEVTIEAIDSTYNSARDATIKGYRKAIYGPFKVAVDAASPVIEETKQSTDTNYISSSKTISYGGTITDDFKLAEQPIKVSVKAPGSATPQEIIISSAGSDVERTWQYDFTVPGGTDGMYELSFIVTDNFGRTSTVIRNVYKDTKPPKISINSVTPTVAKDGEPTKYLNGTFNVTGTVEENYLDKVWYEVKTDTGSYNSITPVEEAFGQWYAFNGEIKIDSTNVAKYKTTDENSVEVIVHAVDKAGNEATYSTTTFNANSSYKISQATDKPVIAGNNFVNVLDKNNLSLTSEPENNKGNVFDSSNNNKLFGSVSDDDGIEKITVSLYQEDGTTKIGDKDFTVNKQTSANFSYELPKVSGIYKVEVVAKDITYDSAVASVGVTKEQIQENRIASTGKFFIAVDNQNPVITETLVKTTDKKFVSEATGLVNFKGEISDDWGIKDYQIKVKYTPATGQSTSDENLKKLEQGFVKTNNTWTYSANLVNGIREGGVSYSYGSGDYEFEFIATDNAGKTSSVKRTICKDTVAPVFGTSTITDPATAGYKAEEVKPYISTKAVNGWYNSNTLNIRGGVKDAESGILKVEYTLAPEGPSATWTELSGTTSFGGTIAGVEHLKNITLRATDIAGNTTRNIIDNIQIDVGAPSAEIISIDGNTTSRDKLTNGQADIVITGKAEDALSGIDSVLIKIGDRDFSTPDVTIQGDASFTPFIKDGNPVAGTVEWSATIPKAKITKSGTVWARVKDKAGNIAEISLFAIQLDNIKPYDIEFNSSIDNATVNKKIKIFGTANDDQKLTTIELDYKLGTATLTDTGWNKLTVDGTENATSVTGTYNWVINDVDTEKAFGSIADGQKVTLRVTATDAAGNSEQKLNVITVDQNTDRPVITFTNLNPLDGMLPTNHLFFNNTKMMGNLVDDDGVAGVVFKIIAKPYMVIEDGKDVPASPESLTPPTLEDFRSDSIANVPLNSGSWNYTIESQGKHDIYFYVKDAKGSEFISKVSGNTHDSVYLKDETNEFGGSTNPSTILYIRIDTIDPEIADDKYNFYSAKNLNYIYSTSFDVNSDNNSIDWATSVKDRICGGDTSKLKIRLKATDANGIESVTGKFEGQRNSITAVPKKVDTDGSGIYEFVDILLGNTELTGNLKDGSNNFTITVVDNAGRPKTKTITLNIDNTKPVVTVSSPNSTTTVSGNVNAYGTVSESSDLFYAISTSRTVSPDNKTTAITEYSPNSGSPVTIADIKDKVEYTELKGATLSWYIYFDGDTDESQTVAHSKILNNYLVDYGITTQEALKAQENPFDTIVKLYLWVKAIDKAGNVTEQVHEIKLDPQGDRPTVAINYPEKDSDTLGGVIKVYGEANDNIAVETVWLQVISKKNHNSDWASCVQYTERHEVQKDDKGKETEVIIIENVTKFEPTTADLDLLVDNGYEVYLMSSFNPLEKDSSPKWSKGGSIPSGKTASDYAILANTSGTTWNIKINVKDELNPASGDANIIAIRALARDNDKKISIPNDRIFKIDSDKPIFGSSQPFYLVQSDSSDYDATQTASREYAADMYVKGSWYLIGSVEDDVGIKSLIVKDKAGAAGNKELVKDSKAIAGGADFNVKVDGKKVFFKIKLPTASGVGSLDYTFEAEDIAEGTSHSQTYDLKINFDNKAPDLIGAGASGYNISPSVKQASNFYTFGSSVKEDAISSVNQSGFNYVAFYFMRRNDKTVDQKDYIYDVMQPRKIGDDNNSYNKVNITAGVSGISYDEGLFWKDKIVTRDPDTLSKLILNAKDQNIHVGGLVKIGGIIYFITAISADGLNITINGNVPVDYVNAKFALANVVNNTVQETDSGALQNDGYYLKPANDDGDRMIESVTKQGTTWMWEANICSKNIPDGPIELHYVAFDKAGNFSKGIMGTVKEDTYKGYSTLDVKNLETSKYSVYAFNAENPGFVSNNQPRIAGVKFGSDDNANGIVDSTEMNVAYSGWYSTTSENKKSGVTVNGKKANGDAINEFNIPEALNEAALTIKGATRIIPEIVGGNNGLSYTYSVAKKGDDDKYKNPYFNSISKNLTDIDSINDDIRSEEQTTIALSAVDLLKPGNIGTIQDGNEQKVTFKIWDKTEGTEAGVSSQAATINIIANIILKDSEKAKVHFKPFYWRKNAITNLIESSVYKNNAENGHIELEADWQKTLGIVGAYDATATSGVSDSDPKVSGKISIKGTATDNVSVNEIYIKIPTFKDNGSAGDRNHVRIAYRDSNGTWQSDGNMTDNGFEFELDGDELFDQKTGNTVNFIFSWDTSKIAGMAKTDVAVEIMAKDKGSISLNEAGDGVIYTTTGPSVASSTQTGSIVDAKKVETCYYKMDVVPYITEVTRNSGYNTQRSKFGNIPVLRGEVGNTITGFNIPNDASVYLQIRNADGIIETQATGNAQSFTIHESAVNGVVSVKVNNIANLNNKNSNASEYNQEVSGSYKWSDDRVLSVFKSDAKDIFPDSAYPKYPAMAMGNTGELFASYSISSMSEVWYSQLNGAVQKNLFTAGDQPEETDIMVAGASNVNIMYQANHHYGGTQDRWSAKADGAGSINLYNAQAPKNTIYAKGRYWRFEGVYHNQMLQQHINARSATSGNGESGIIHTIWHDTLNNSIKYSNVENNSDTRGYRLIQNADDDSSDGYASLMQEIAWVVLDGDADLDDIVETNQTRTEGYNGGQSKYPNNTFNHKYMDGKSKDSAYSVVLGMTPAQREAIMDRPENENRKNAAINANGKYKDYDYIDNYEGITPSNACGETAAICVTSTGLPVVVYYDVQHNMLRLARTNQTNPKGIGANGAGSWRIQQIPIVNTHLGNSADYIAAKIDSDNYLHVTFQNSKGQLVYVKSSNNPTNGTAYTFNSSVVVDAECGMWADLTVDSNNVPYISYMKTINSYDSIKIAYCEDSDTTKSQNWETIFAPMNVKASNVRTCIEARPSNANGGQTNADSDTTSYWKAAVGFCPKTDYRVIKYIGDGAKVYKSK